MSGLADDAESAIELANDAVLKLRKIDPLNALLWFWIMPPEGVSDPFEGDENKMRREMKDRFWRRDKPWQKEAGAIVTAVVTSNYFFALQEEIKRLSTGVEGNPISPTDKER